MSLAVYTPQGDHRDIVARALCADEAKAQILVGVYFDAGASPLDAGCLTAYDALGTFTPQSLRLATVVKAEVLAPARCLGRSSNHCSSPICPKEPSPRARQASR